MKKKLIVLGVIAMLFALLLQSCAERLCPAYSTYPEYRRARR